MDWMKDFFVWGSKDEGNTCVLNPIQKFENSELLNRGVDLLGSWVSEAYFPMNPEFPKDIGLADNLRDCDSVAVISYTLKQFLEKKGVTNTQFLPVGIMNHKGKLIAAKYFIVNPVKSPDCLDVKNSEPTYYNIAPSEISEVERLVLDPKRIAPEIAIFRVRNFWGPIVIRAELAQEIVAAGFSGISWKNPLKYMG
jgi:hypothetical protein